MILVVGANGRVGGGVVDVLRSRGTTPRVLVRDREAAVTRFGDAVEIAVGDLADRTAVAGAMSDVEAVFLCSPVHPDQVSLQRSVVNEAAARGAFIVKLSGLGTFAGSYVDSGAWHAATEAEIRASGTGFTFLHPYFFMQNLLFMVPGARKDHVIRSGVGDAALAMVAVEDIAEVAAALLLDPSLAPGQTLPLTEGRARTYSEVAELFAGLLDAPVRYATQTLEQVEQSLSRSGQPDWHIRILLQFNRAFREGLGSEVSPAVGNILGRAPTTLEICLARGIAEVSAGSNPFPS